MKYNPDIHKRHSIRLRGYDYAQEGAYFVTICIKERECLFGSIEKKKIILTDFGIKIEKSILLTPEKYPEIAIDKYIIMPNHIHLIIFILKQSQFQGKGMMNYTLKYNSKIDKKGLINQTPTNDLGLMKNKKLNLGHIIRYFKARSTSIIRKNSNIYFQWQRNYYEHIIRNDIELKKYRQYIIDNPEKWDEDEENPNKIEIYNENK